VSEVAFKATAWREFAEEEVRRLGKLLVQRTKTHQAGCEHERVAECDYEPSNYGNSLPPLRICLRCRMTETGWGSGFNVLRATKGVGVVKIDRDQLYRERRGLAIRDDHKGPLIRREVTVAQLIESGGDLPEFVAERERNWGA
jgi:hypothetical protein